MRKRAAIGTAVAALVFGSALTFTATADTPTNMVERRATSCTTDAQGYCTIGHSLGVAPETILLEERIPAGQKPFDAHVVTSTYTADDFKVRVMNLDGTPRAGKKTFITYQASALKEDGPGTPPTSEPETPPTTEEPPPTTEEPPPTTGPENPPADAEKCTDPSKVWGTRSGGGPVHAPNVGDGLQYYGGPNLWNDNGTVTMSMGVCSHAQWYVDAKAQNKGDGAVLAYPNLHKDWIDWSNGKMPKLSEYKRIPTKWRHDGPGNVGTWNWAYDVWIDGVGNDDGVTELMIWTEYKGQRPAGSKVKTVTVDGREWDLWVQKQWGIVSYVAKDQSKSGSIDIKKFTDHLVSEGLISSDATLGQVGYGVEIVDTGGDTRRFDVTDFQVDAYKN